MATIDNLGTWEQLGTLIVSNQWELFSIPVIGSEIFRITTTILNQQDWDELKIRSASYIRFYYPDGSTSPKWYVPVSQSSIIRKFPDDLSSTATNKHVGCILSHPKINHYSLASYAKWQLKLEVLTS